MRVEREEVDGELGVDVQLEWVLELEPVEVDERGPTEEPVGSPVLDSGHGGGDCW